MSAKKIDTRYAASTLRDVATMATTLPKKFRKSLLNMADELDPEAALPNWFLRKERQLKKRNWGANQNSKPMREIRIMRKALMEAYENGDV